jgi:hypothetical protein
MSRAIHTGGNQGRGDPGHPTRNRDRARVAFYLVDLAATLATLAAAAWCWKRGG